jgi:DNA-binding transcriptional LysR family regulator
VVESAEGFEVFVAVVDAGSISAAARLRCEPRETVSRQLARLEERLGVRLLHRETRRLTPTAAGQELYARARPLVVAAREAEAAVKRLDDVPRGLVRVSVAPGGAAFVADALLAFLRDHPEVSLEVHLSSRHVDLVAEGFDVALRAGVVYDEALVARRLLSTEVVAVASPAYLARCGTPTGPEDLALHSGLLGMTAGERPARGWPARSGDDVPVSGRLASNDPALLLVAALAGDGIALLPRLIAGPALDDGRLVPVLPDVIGAERWLSAVYVERSYLPAKVSALLDHLSAWAARYRSGR